VWAIGTGLTPSLHDIEAMIGYKSVEASIQGRSVIDVSLEADITSLEEVVVVGYGETQVRKITESLSVVDASKIQNTPLASFDNILQGAATGVQVSAAGGQPGSGVSVRIRGVGSITGSSAPLYVIDGVPINVGNLTEEAQTGNAFANINPNDIESLTVLKDASATSIYGSRGTNGVVLITTKKGKPGQSKVQFNAQYGFSEFENPNDFGVMNGQEFLGYMREATINAGIDPDARTLPSGAVNPDYFPLGDTINTNWVDEALQTGIIQSYNLSVSGGSPKTQYFASIGLYDEEGIAVKTDFRRVSTRFNLKHKINNNATVGLNFTVSEVQQSNRQGAGTTFRDPIYGSFFTSPLNPIFANAEQIAAGEDYGTGYNFNIPGFAGHNIVASQNLNPNNVQTFRTIGNLFATYNILPDLEIRTTFGIDRADLQEDEFLSPNYEKGRSAGSVFEGNAIVHNIKEFDWNWTTTLTYDKELGANQSLQILVGSEMFESLTERNRAEGAGFASDKLQTINSAAGPSDDPIDTDWTKWNLASFFAKVNYSLNDKYFLNLSARRDGSSRFGPDNRWGNFWAAGVAWVLSEENFLSGIGVLDFLKLRAGVGTQGNNSIGNFSWLTDYAYTANLNLNGQTVSGNRPLSLGDIGIGWEKQFTIDVGVDFSLFNRISIGAGYYRKNITDMLFEVPLSRTTGFNDFETNAGEMRNSGWEFELNSTNVEINNFSWTTSFQFSKNKNEIIDVPNGEEFVDSGDQEINREGESVDAWYMPRWAGVDPATGKPLWLDGEGNITDNYGNAGFAVVGQKLPDFYGTLANTLTFKGVSLSASFYYSYGNEVYREVQRFLSSDGSRFGRNQDRNQLSRWQKPGDITDVPRISKGNADGGNNHSTRYLEDGSFIKLRRVTLAYNLPQSWLQQAKLGSVRLYVQALNLKTWTNYRGMDPETGIESRDFGEYPNPRKVLFGIDVQF
ncbi:MAG: TonB-dependent receptor, partial [Cyclobacteriaceae bacterium]|nr:TonB-dependent receptor [Cyclobacteriaceae bacterium HetDA_MAG_MS6]